MDHESGSWLIVGAGLQGCHIAHALMRQAHVSPQAITLLDPHLEPMQLWRQRSRRCGMEYLRSPAAHNIDIPAHALLRYPSPRKPGLFAGPYRRPSLALFNAHAQTVIEESVSLARFIQGRACSLEISDERYLLKYTAEDAGPTRTIAADRVILAPGQPEPDRPAWAGRDIRHLFAADYSEANEAKSTHPIVIGTGLSGVQKALQLAANGRNVTLVGPFPEVHEFDSDPCFLGPRCLTGFHRLTDMRARRRILARARRPGSVPAGIFAALEEAIQTGHVNYAEARVTGRTEVRDGHGQASALQLDNGGEVVGDHFILATGFNGKAPVADWLKPAIQALDLPVDDDGLPIPDGSLQWREGLFVCGRLAELELGPVAANISGGRLAARRILARVAAPPEQ